MKSALVLAFALIFETGCGNRIAPPTKDNSLKEGTGVRLRIAASELARTDASGEPKQGNDPPATFRRVDFKNVSYLISSKNERVSLRDGKREYYQHQNLGNGWFELEDVYYVDITGDERKEAVVVLSAVLCGVSCDGGSHLFYFYTMRKSILKLLWRFETGSLGYGCGLKAFDLSKRKITLEVFNTCNFKGVTLEPRYDSEQAGGKFHSESTTRFAFEFSGEKPVLKNRKVFPNPPADLRSYSATVNINND